MSDFKDISDLKKLIGSAELNLDELECVSGGFGIEDLSPEELETWNSLCAEFGSLAKLAETDDSYNADCKRQLDEIGAFVIKVKKRIDAGG